MRYRLKISYDGTKFHGWQKQLNLPTVQGEIETALCKILGAPVSVLGASRTDTGVHAMGQVAHFDWDKPLRPGHDLRYGIQCLTPHAIVVTQIAEAPEKFHSITDAIDKLYRYRVVNRATPCPLRRNFASWVRRPLDVNHLQSILNEIVGIHDFKSFQATGSEAKTSTRNILKATVERTEGDEVVFQFSGTGFLKQMVRNLVGTAIWLEEHELGASDMKRILLAQDRTQAGPTAEAQGLCLMHINYAQSVDNLCRDLYH